MKDHRDFKQWSSNILFKQLTLTRGESKDLKSNRLFQVNQDFIKCQTVLDASVAQRQFKLPDWIREDNTLSYKEVNLKYEWCTCYLLSSKLKSTILALTITYTERKQYNFYVELQYRATYLPNPELLRKGQVCSIGTFASWHSEESKALPCV